MTPDNVCFYLQNRLILTSQTGGQWYSDASPFSIPGLDRHLHGFGGDIRPNMFDAMVDMNY
jgi:hypothetical protein